LANGQVNVGPAGRDVLRGRPGITLPGHDQQRSRR
jgi:hypothetical protein